jgi:hypothetical protein
MSEMSIGRLCALPRWGSNDGLMVGEQAGSGGGRRACGGGADLRAPIWAKEDRTGKGRNYGKRKEARLPGRLHVSGASSHKLSSFNKKKVTNSYHTSWNKTQV